jgi:hypothetical protein
MITNCEKQAKQTNFSDLKIVKNRWKSVDMVPSLISANASEIWVLPRRRLFIKLNRLLRASSNSPFPSLTKCLIRLIASLNKHNPLKSLHITISLERRLRLKLSDCLNSQRQRIWSGESPMIQPCNWLYSQCQRIWLDKSSKVKWHDWLNLWRCNTVTGSVVMVENFGVASNLWFSIDLWPLTFNFQFLTFQL